MSFWSKLGKIGLAAAPYVAAPFTGGASLMATGATNKALGKWNEHDARKNAEKGIGPSSFDRALGGISEGAGMASGVGAFGKIGTGGKLGGMFGGLFGGNNNRYPMDERTGIAPTNPPGQGGLFGDLMKNVDWGSIFNRDGGQQQQPPQGQGGFMNPDVMRRGQVGVPRYDTSNPNLSNPIMAGRNDAMRNQPWRKGTPIMGQDDAGAPIQTGQTPPIFPNHEVNYFRDPSPSNQPKLFGNDYSGEQMAKPMGGMFRNMGTTRRQQPQFVE